MEEKIMKKILSVVLAVAMVLSVLTANVFASDVYTYDFDNQVVSGYTGLLSEEQFAAFVQAIQMDGAQINIVYTVQTDGWIQLTLQGNGNSILDGSKTGEADDQYVSGEVVYLDGSPTEEDRTFTISGADLINNFTKLNDTPNFNGTWDGRHKGDFYRGMTVENLMGVTLNTAGSLTLKSLTVSVEGDVEPIVVETTEEEPAAEESTDDAPAAETETPADTGIVLTLAPMAVAAAALVVAKKRK